MKYVYFCTCRNMFGTKKRLLRTLLLLLAGCIPALGSVSAQNAPAAETVRPDSLVVSLLTCSPGQEIYEYYGHTALLVQNVTKGESVVINYGLFNYSAPHFVWRFMRGECNYTVGAAPLDRFLPEYAERGSSVVADRLNLSQKEAQRLFESVSRQCLNLGWTYPYNFFEDNCGTRVLDEIEKCLDGRLEYTNAVVPQSLRAIVHRYSAKYRWSAFGQDLLLGAEADTVAGRRAQEFAPLVLRQDLCGARIVGSDGRVRPLVTDSTVLVPSRAVPLQQGFPLSPIACAVVLLLAAVALSLFEWRRGKVCWPFDATLMLLHGAAGVVVTFMFFFSTHPTVGSNWLILLLNPVPLLLIYPMMKRERRMAHSPVHMAFAVWTGLFLLLAPLMPQKFPAALCVLALILLYRSAGYVLLIRKTDNTKRNKSLKIKTHD